jgi:catechol 2,3-dioxygenase-like lactoylglutathione lyase family enzyme
VIRGVLETALYVQDLDRSQAFYEKVLGCKETLREKGRLHALLLPGASQVLLLFAVGKSLHPTDTPGGRIPPHDGHGQLHLAFEIGREDIEPWRMRLREQGIGVESEVDCPKGGHSIYFRDPDGHLLELVTRECWGL